MTTRTTTRAPLEEALDALGPFGLYQRYTLLMLCLPNILSAMYSLNYIFVADQVPFRCAVPECEGPSILDEPQYLNETVSALLPSTSSCDRYTPLLNHSCRREDYHLTDTQPCLHFVYSNMDTIYAEFELACREWMRTLVGTVRNSALPFALILTGFLSDKYGRRTALCVFGACAALLGVVKSFSVSYEMYLAMEFLEAALGYGFNSAAYVMTVELARPSLRAMFACATGVAYGVGGVLFAWLAWRVRYWRDLLLIAHLLALLLPLYWLLVDESVRWLHARGRLADTERVIRKSARWNKIILNEELIVNLHKSDEVDGKRVDEGAGAGAVENPWLGLVKSRVLMVRMALCSWCWIAVAFVYYGLTINSVSLSGDKYVNFALNMAMEIVASLLLMMALERIGRKWSIFAAFLLCGFACVTPFILSNEEVKFALFFVGKLSITFAFNSIYVYTAELFPTRVRSSALAACSLLGRLGSILAPQTPLLSVGVQATLYGACCALAALAVLGAPETRRAPLPPDTRSAETLRPPPAPADLAPPPAPAPPPPRVLSTDTKESRHEEDSKSSSSWQKLIYNECKLECS